MSEGSSAWLAQGLPTEDAPLLVSYFMLSPWSWAAGNVVSELIHTPSKVCAIAVHLMNVYV